MSARKKIVKGKNKKFKVESDWKNYYGSSDDFKQEVLTNGKENFKREIIHLCNSKSEMSYLEMKEIFARDALIKDDYANLWVSCRINRRNLKGLLNGSESEVEQDRDAS